MKDEVNAKRNIFEGKPEIYVIGFVDHYGRPNNWSLRGGADDYWTIPELAWIADLAKKAKAGNYEGLTCKGGDDCLCYSGSDIKTDYMIPKEDK